MGQSAPVHENMPYDYLQEEVQGLYMVTFQLMNPGSGSPGEIVVMGRGF